MQSHHLKLFPIPFFLLLLLLLHWSAAQPSSHARSRRDDSRTTMQLFIELLVNVFENMPINFNKGKLMH